MEGIETKDCSVPTLALARSGSRLKRRDKATVPTLDILGRNPDLNKSVEKTSGRESNSHNYFLRTRQSVLQIPVPS